MVAGGTALVWAAPAVTTISDAAFAAGSGQPSGQYCHDLPDNAPSGATQWCSDRPISSTEGDAVASEAHFGYTVGCSGTSGRIWAYGWSFNTYGYWADPPVELRSSRVNQSSGSTLIDQ
jgi:hypothetical protein